MNIPERIAALRACMKQEGIDAYLIPTADFHGSEYVGAYFKCRKYITGFTGSAGTAVITADAAGLWTDGRYFLQAARQLEGTGVTLYRMGEEGVPTVNAWLQDTLREGQTLGFDGRTVSAGSGASFEKELASKNIRISWNLDLIDRIWEERPALSCRPVWIHDIAYAGISRTDKLQQVREKMAAVKADHYLLSSLDDIAWLLNVRGDDVACNPVVLSYLMMTPETVNWYVQDAAVSEEVRSALTADGIRIADYSLFYEEVARIPEESRILADLQRVNYTLCKTIPAGTAVINAENPTLLPKAVKNETEQAGIRAAHVRDGVAVTKFIHWLKTNAASGSITELSAGTKLEEFRSAGEHYIGPSFEPIIAYGPHASIIHYSADAETNVTLEPRDFVLCDTGGQYLEGTTDITRTVVLGETTREEKEMFTRVLRGHLNLAGAKFQEGASGLVLDYLAREPLWEIGLDYRHGTGHGVGCCLNVHEGPNSFHWKQHPGRRADTVLQEGMLTSDEPGYYKDNAYGIRHENLMLTRKAEKTEYGQFMQFETVTLVPFDLEAVLPEMMSQREIALLNAYHRNVYDTISPYFEGEELAWLKEATQPIQI